MNLPSEFVKSIKELLGAEADLFFDALKKPRERGLRVNTLKTDAPPFAGLAAVPWCETGFYYDNQAKAPLGKNPLYNAGLYYIQEPSAMSAAALLDVQKGDRVLDLCASPGGKATQIAAALNGTGLLVANDATLGRIPQLLQNIEMAGVQNAIITCERADRLAAHFEGFFTRVLVDAPCSGEGMFRKDSSAIAAWDAEKPRRLAVIQKNILKDAARMVAVGGHMVYSTCTFNRTENEDVVEGFLNSHSDFKMIGEPLRIWPHTHRGEGHFAVKLRRTDGYQRDIGAGRQGAAPTSPYFQEFIDKYDVKLPRGWVSSHGDRLFIPPMDYPDITGLRIMRVGLLLGTLKKQRFEPSYALALALKKCDFGQVIDMLPNAPSIQKFLGGDSFAVDAPDGYNLFCVAGYPVGWAKVLKARLKGRII